MRGRVAAPLLALAVGGCAERASLVIPPTTASAEARFRAFSRYRMSVGGEVRHPTRGDHVRAAVGPAGTPAPQSRAVDCLYLGTSPECLGASSAWDFWMNVPALEPRVTRWSGLRTAGLSTGIPGALGVVGSSLALGLMDQRSDHTAPIAVLSVSAAALVAGTIMVLVSGPDRDEVEASARDYNRWLRARVGLTDDPDASVEPTDPTRVLAPGSAAQAVDPERAR